MCIILIAILVFIMLLSCIFADIYLVWVDTLVASVDLDKHPLLLEYNPNHGKVYVSIWEPGSLNYSSARWGCAPEITKGCIDMTNASSTYLSIAIGAIVGALITWVVYALQKSPLSNRMKISKNSGK